MNTSTLSMSALFYFYFASPRMEAKSGILPMSGKFLFCVSVCLTVIFWSPVHANEVVTIVCDGIKKTTLTLNPSECIRGSCDVETSNTIEKMTFTIGENTINKIPCLTASKTDMFCIKQDDVKLTPLKITSIRTQYFLDRVSGQMDHKIVLFFENSYISYQTVAFQGLCTKSA